MNLKSAFNYTKRITKTGALFQTSKKVENEITRFVDTQKPQIIVEFGAGQGNITQAILNKMHPQSKLYAFEIFKEFCAILENINDSRLIIVNKSAEFVFETIKEPKISCIISSIPFSYIPIDILDKIINDSHKKLDDHGVMSQVLYSKFHLKKYIKYFKNCETCLLLNFPPEFIYHCYK